MIKLIWTWIFCAIAIFANAQHHLQHKADHYYKHLSYSKAIDDYQRVVRKDPMNQHCVLRLADCYRLIKDYENSGKWYEHAMKLPAIPDTILLFYGHALMQQGRFEEAQQVFDRYHYLRPADGRGDRFARGIDQLHRLMQDSIRYSVWHVPINTKASDFGVAPWQDGLIFASSRDDGSPFRRKFDWLNAPYLDLYFSHPKAIDEGSDETDLVEDYSAESAKPETGLEHRWTKPVPLKGEVNTKYHESSLTYAKGSSIVWFTRNKWHEGEVGVSEKGHLLLDIYSAENDDNTFRNVQPFIHNSLDDNHSVTHPSISADGLTLYFTSDMPGGFGGKDIYKSVWNGLEWLTPENLGELVNTRGDEMFPFIHENGTLYFSSDGHPGFGHLDIFFCRTNSKKLKVINLGYPINTSFDDFAFYLDSTEEHGYLSSNRPGGFGDDDIYEFSAIRPAVLITVIDSIARLPIENAEITMRNHLYDDEVTLLTDQNGEVFFKADFGVHFDGVCRTVEFADEQFQMNTIPQAGEIEFNYVVELYNPPPAITAIVIDRQTGQRLPGSNVEFIKLYSNDTTFRKADRNGRFAIALDKNTYYQINVRHAGYLTYSDKVSTTLHSYSGDTIIPLDMQKIELNKPIVLENIHYDFDKWFIRPDAYPDLEMVAKLLKDNPTIKVELSSHTDSRGSDSYNVKLSHKRAMSARNHLVLYFGVDASRISAKGYGETMLVNHCSNGVVCPDPVHERNRRTEFRIVGFIEGYDLEQSILETREEGSPDPFPHRNDQSVWRDVPRPVVDQQVVITEPRREEPRPVYDPVTGIQIQKTPGRKDSIPVKSEPLVSANPVAVDTTPKAQAASDIAYTVGTPTNDPKMDFEIAVRKNAEPGFDVWKRILPDFYNDAGPEKAGEESKPVFRIQLGAFKDMVSSRAFPDLGEFREYVFSKPMNDLFIYMIGEFSTYEKATDALKSVHTKGYKDAFITAWKNGVRLESSEILKLIQSDIPHDANPAEEIKKPPVVVPDLLPQEKSIEKSVENPVEKSVEIAVEKPVEIPVEKREEKPGENLTIPVGEVKESVAAPEPEKPVDEPLTEDPGQSEFADDPPAESDDKFDITLLPNMEYTGDAVSGFVFRLNLGSYKTTMKDKFSSKLGNFRPYLIHQVENNLNVYYIGDYSDIYAANRALEEIFRYGFGNSFIDGWKGGQKIPYGELRQMLSE